MNKKLIILLACSAFSVASVMATVPSVQEVAMGTLSSPEAALIATATVPVQLAVSNAPKQILNKAKGQSLQARIKALSTARRELNSTVRESFGSAISGTKKVLSLIRAARQMQSATACKRVVAQGVANFSKMQRNMLFKSPEGHELLQHYARLRESKGEAFADMHTLQQELLAS